MKLERDESGAKVGRFYREGKEVRFDGLVESRTAYSKEEVVAADDDVVVESEKILEPELNGKNDAAELEVKKPEKTEQIVQPDPIQAEATTSTKTKTPEKVEKVEPAELFKKVEPRPLETEQEVAVYVVHVESVDRVWVSRLQEDEAILSLMADLAELQKTLTKASRKKAGAVFGAVYPGDGEFYRVVLEDRAGPGLVTVHYMDFGNSDVIPVETLLNLPGHIASLPAFSIPINFSSGLEASPENLDLVRNTLEADNLTVTMVDGKGHFKIDGRKVFCSSQDFPALTPVAEVERPSVAPVYEVPVEVPAEAVEVPKKDEPKSEENIEEEIVPAPSVVKDLIKKFSEPSGPDVEAERAGAVLNQSQQPQKIPTGIQGAGEGPEETAVTECADKIKKWVNGEQVVAKFPGIGWRSAVVLDCTESGVMISTSLDGSMIMVDHCDVKSDSVPSDALNLLERDLNRNFRPVRSEAATSRTEAVPAVTKINIRTEDNMSARPLSNIGQKTLPASSELGKYSTTASGSRHLQAVIAMRNYELNRWDQVLILHF